MQPAPRIDVRDGALIQIVDAAMAEAARRSGPWLVCRVGCTECCMGPFPITQLDARRLRRGLSELDTGDPQRAGRVRERARQCMTRISRDFPGDPRTGILAEGEEAEARFADFGNDEPCPALDPQTGACDLYVARPITCRTFGPPVRAAAEALGVCELCFHGATDTEIAACAVESDPEGVERALLGELEETTGVHGRTIVAFCLAL
ncbi:MAG TPA: YkgJ family cysteine cluster protein [Bryobacteraceae bacterium]|nr:YkgJ family cysteine cluster protein [Bryobacteraceae bacterium]